MKNSLYLNLNRVIFILLTFFLASFILFNTYVYYKERIYINYCIEQCYNDIYNYVRQEDSKIYFGHYSVHIGGI